MSDTPQFPLVPAPFAGDSREVDAGACFDWLRQGWAMFIAYPGIWFGSAVLFLCIIMPVSLVPFFGQVAANVLLPVFAGGFLAICREVSEDREPEIILLFKGFQHNAGALVKVGAIYAAGIFGVAVVAFLLISGGLLGAPLTGRVAGFGIAFGGMLLAGLFVMLASIPVIMAVWFAPALVYFHDMEPLPAMRASFAAGVKNWLPMLVFGTILVVAAFFAMLSVGLGFLLFIPIFCAAAYASYRDIFVGT